MSADRVIKSEIHMYTCDPCCLTPKEFEELDREVTSRIVAGIAGQSERILGRLLQEHRGRYVQAKERNAWIEKHGGKK